jgi:ABC-type branched-subunit amino acid transport system permease subunit
VSTLLSYALPGIPYGCDFALMAVGLVVTFRTTGVFNLAYGAQAFAAAFIFDLLVTAQGFPVWAAFVVSVLLISPALGWAFDHFLYRHIPTASTTAKVVSSVGLFLAIPLALPILFGSTPRLNPPSLWLNPATVEFHLGSTPVNGGELSATVITVAAVAALLALLRWSPIGLEMRAVVESRRLAQLQGVDAGRVSGTAWALSSLLAGLAGVLLLPLSAQLTPADPLEFTSLLLAGITAAALARMRSVGGALAAAIGLGVVESVLRGYLPSGTLAQAVVPAFPFVVLFVTLVGSRGLRSIERRGDPLAGVDPPPAPPAVSVRDPRLEPLMKWGFRILVVAFVISTLTWVPGYWVTSLTEGLVLSTMFLSITLITGMSGQLSLCQATFAGIGGFAAGQLAAHFGLGVLIGAVVGAMMAAAVGALIALVAVRISGLILTILTLAFALFCDEFVFQYSWSGGGLNGVVVPRPEIGPFNFSSDKSFFVLALIVLLLCMGLVLLVQRGTTGRYLAAVRGSEAGAASLGISLLRSRVTVFALSAGIAGVGGTMFGSLYHSVSADSFAYEFSLVFVVVVVTTGANRLEGALQAGMGFAIISLLLTYAPERFQGVTTILFAVGAMTYAQHPEGIVEYQKRKWLTRVSRLLAVADARRGSSAPVGLPAEPAAEVPSRG